MRPLHLAAIAVFLLACGRSPSPAQPEADAEVVLPAKPQAAPELATRKLCEHGCDAAARECRVLAEDDAAREQCSLGAINCKTGCRR